MKLKDLLDKDLVGGTLVEYKANCGFSLEYGRGVITEIGVKEDVFCIKTGSDECWLEQNISPEVEGMGFTADVQQRGPVFLISSSMGWCYMAAPKGLDIPTRPNWMDVSDAEFEETLQKNWQRKG